MIRGIVFENVSDKLIVEATNADVARFAKGASVAIAPVESAYPAAIDEIVGQTLYDKRGRAVAIVTGLEVHRNAIDATAFGDAAQRFIYGPVVKKLTVEAL